MADDNALLELAKLAGQGAFTFWVMKALLGRVFKKLDDQDVATKENAGAAAKQRDALLAVVTSSNETTADHSQRLALGAQAFSQLRSNFEALQAELTTLRTETRTEIQFLRKRHHDLVRVLGPRWTAEVLRRGGLEPDDDTEPDTQPGAKEGT